MTDRTQPDVGSTHIIRFALELGLLWIDGSGRDKVREALTALDALEAKLASIRAGGVQALSAAPAGWKLVPVNPTPEMWKAAKSVPDPNPPYPPHYGLVWDAMLAASPTPPAEQQSTKETSGGFYVWRDISTAPKDGSRFVATGHNYGLYSEVRHTCVAQWFRGCWMEASDWNETSELKYLTHWMPLPSPPDDVAAPAEQQAAPKAAPGDTDGCKQALGSNNCMQCCVSYMLGLPLVDVPHFADGGGWDQFASFVESKGYSAVMLPGEHEPEADYLASGRTERGTSHMVVMNDGKLVFDPHPSNAGLSSVQCVWLLAKRAAPKQEAQEPAFWMNEKGHTWSHSDWKQFPKHRAKYPIPLYPHFPAPQPAPAPLSDAIKHYLEAQDALDNREYAGINAESYEKLIRCRNASRKDLDAAIAAQGGKV